MSACSTSVGDVPCGKAGMPAEKAAARLSAPGAPDRSMAVVGIVDAIEADSRPDRPS